MNKVLKSFIILPTVLMLFACKKKNIKDVTTHDNKTTKIVTKKGNTTSKKNSQNITTSKKQTTKKNNSNLYHYAFVDYDETVLYEGDMTKGWKIADSLVPKASRANEGNYFYYFTGWSPEVNSITDDDVTYTAQYEKLEIPYEISGSKLYFGYYPQTLITDTTITSSLNNKAHLPSTNNSWISYNYYNNNLQSDYMWYIDIDADNDSRFDYRGVYFEKYRPYNITKDADGNNSNIDEYSYLLENVYWFEYKKIEWNILENNDGSRFIVANLALDSQEFCPGHDSIPMEHNGSTDYYNAYKYSEIRKWLNNEFYNTAFNDTEKKIIDLTNVKTRRFVQLGSSNSYNDDYVFLLSDTEVTDYLADRKCKATNYAKIQGISTNESGYAIWGLRTPSTGSPSYSSSAIQAQFVSVEGNIFAAYTEDSEIGIRPCLVLKS